MDIKQKRQTTAHYDQIRQKVREQQQAEADRSQAAKQRFERQETNPLDRLKGEQK